jgi:plasmid stabilization system protein ParE
VKIKWSKSALIQLDKALDFILDKGYASYAAELEESILLRIENIIENYQIYPIDKYKMDNDGSYRAFEINEYRISYRVKNSAIHILRIRHTSRRTRKY